MIRNRNYQKYCVVIMLYIFFLSPKIRSQNSNLDIKIAVMQERLEETIRVSLASAIKFHEIKEWDIAAKNLDLVFSSLATLIRSNVLAGQDVALITQLHKFVEDSINEKQLILIIEDIYRNSTNGYDFSISSRQDFETSKRLSVAMDFIHFIKEENDLFALRTELEAAIEIAEQLRQSENEFYATLGENILDSLVFESSIFPFEAEPETVEKVQMDKAFSSLYLKLVRPDTFDFKFNVNNKYIKRQIKMLTKNRRYELNNWLARITKYIPKQREIFNANNLPKDLVFLSVIESGLNPRAHSRKAAKGLWQFIYSTGKSYGLKRNLWKDDRYDPVLSGNAAVQHLSDLYKRFKSWELAIAAYNSGVGRVSSAIRKGKSRNFWMIRKYLPRETREYVPLFYAVLIIIKNPRKYNINKIEYLPPIQYNSVNLTRSTDLDILAKCAGCKEDDIKQLNPSLLRNVTPPGRKFVLRTPIGSGQAFQTAYKNLKIFNKQALYKKHRVKRGEN